MLLPLSSAFHAVFVSVFFGRLGGERREACAKWFAVYMIALPLVIKGSAMQAGIKGCDLSIRTSIALFEHGH